MAGEPEQTVSVPSTTFLLDLAQSLGRIEGQNQLILQEQGNAAESRKAMYQSIDAIKVDVSAANHKLTSVADRVAAIEPDVTKMKAFRAQIALAVFAVTAAVTGAINLIWIAVTHLGDIKAALRSFLSP
jgi:hypothetical protein